ncbi:Archaeal/vacuolar-type H+-ATPase subunit I (plasmid) [Rubrobacter radiotolerans]|uniref:Archaeal/vacuolar-type H+-ATPase subunit I n=1 Tax=Rubrobacter radiotolerans TaxID=42256 RepID=A0A023X848_RUBRA|nr:V-type ATPase 116kDa subunit family protein [Rubrobacter radiotolerans]AHY48225.1 Archaeal/vacuolar-type H+-ATPase subunit I [Rubrobacter radiotolerans]MDX5895260.1 V-type ATPase 116kDa subunit family protein [Rubrobacter radiotolerans]SMC01916.1 V/A-type H+-transporting ATPase subunit I [Rubrobacter radiotolerans DSM 5868]
MALVQMSRVRILGPKAALYSVLEELHRLELVQLAEIGEEVPAGDFPPEESRRYERAEDLRYLAAELEALLDLIGPDGSHREVRADLVPGAVDTTAIRRSLERVVPEVERLKGRLETLRDEEIVLPRYVEPLERLLPLVPELADMEEKDLDRLKLDTVAVVLNTDDEGLVQALREEFAGELGARFELVYEKIEKGVIGCVLVFAHDDSGTVHALLGKGHVRHVALPKEYEKHSLSGSVAMMRERVAALPEEIRETEKRLGALLKPYEGEWRLQLAGLRAELEQLDAANLAGGTRRAFVVACWVPTVEVPRLRGWLEDRIGREVVVEELAVDRHDEAVPVLMKNPKPARPFESLVKLMDLPRPGTLDPTGLMTLFLPIIFGAMVADIAYGVLLLAAAIVMKRRFTEPGAMRDLSSVLLVGSVWSVIFGYLFGELLGNLGRDLFGYFSPLWGFYRPEGLVPLLVFALALGATHVVLGLLLGIWQGWQERHRGEVVERFGTLLAIVGVFGLAGLAVGMLPDGAITPAVAAVVVGLVLMMAAQGRMGLLMGPLEFIGTLSNILSYLRIAAVGLASAYLAIVANQFAGVGPVWFGVLIAAFFHALNLALAGFSPMIQAMRLHYVEFFSKFYEGGGRAFRPFGSRTPAPATTEKHWEYDTLAP